jgi:hypothetical protein
MDCWVSFYDAAGAEVTAHLKPVVTPESRVFGHVEQVSGEHMYADFAGFLGGGSIVIKLNLDPKAQPIRKLQKFF